MTVVAEFTTDHADVIPVYEALKDVIGDQDSPAVADVDWDWHFKHDRFLRVQHDGVLAGIVAFYRQGDRTWEVHMNMLPGHRGPVAQVSYDLAVSLMRINCGATRLTCQIPHKYPNVWGFAERQGYRLVGEDAADKFYELELTRWAA